jgi:hypothetical protein
MEQNTPLVQITQTWIESNGNQVQVIENEGTDLQLWMSMTIDPSLVGNGYRFDINWQIIEVMTSHIQLNTWSSELFGPYPLLVDQTFAAGGGSYSWFIENSAGNFGVHDGGGQWAETQGSGMYILRVLIFIDTSEYEVSIYKSFGTSQWALSDDLAFWCE